jgi:cation:H+ antiporter
MWANLGSILLGTLLLVLGTDSLSQGVSGLLARNSDEAYPAALGGSVAAAVLAPLAILVAALAMAQPDLALGGLVGAALAQLALLLGLAALAAPLMVRPQALNWINPALPVAIVLAWVLGLDQVYSRVDGALLVTAFVAVLVLLLRFAARERAAMRSLFEPVTRRFGLSMLLLRLLVGGVLTGLGAWRLVVGSVDMAQMLVINPLIAGLLVLGPASALGGLPTARSAARRGNGDFALGQGLFGALACVLLLLGALALWHPLSVPASLVRIEWPIVGALAVAVYPMMRSDGTLSAREGGVLLGSFAVFVLVEIGLTRI